ncbi:c-type cytochrome [Bosea sp. 117]|uniref:c-type cytochrome n=1 Tax=Bosea sp. 117 TaxID=1125973 RepID=UPI00049422F2|nr:c-type cytochrome [Bosea sp. 117]
MNPANRQVFNTKTVIASGLAAIAFGALLATPAAGADKRVQRGEYLVHIMDCTGCHTPGALAGKPDASRFLAGSNIGFGIPDLGVFYPPNLTPDKETGIGGWSEADIVKAVRTGERPDGRMLVPVMPYHSYSKLTDQDAAALAAYLKSMKPVSNKAPAMVGASEKPVAPYLTVKMP